MKSRRIMLIALIAFVLFLLLGGAYDYYAASRIQFEVVTNPQTIPADGQTKAVLKVLVTDANGKQRGGDRIFCLVNYGNLRASRVKTDQNGFAEFEYFPIRATSIMKAQNDTIQFYDESISKVIQIMPKTKYVLTISTPTQSGTKTMTSDDLFK